VSAICQTPAVPVIVADNLTKYFSRRVRRPGPLAGVRSLFSTERTTVRAVDRIGFTIDAGEIVGYLGPNGAGKSTTIKMLTGILVPTSGTVLVNGIVPWRDRRQNAQSIGAVFGQRTQLWYGLPVRDSLQMLAKIYGVPRKRYDERLAEFCELLGLDEFLDAPVRTLSLGQRMRSDLAAAMLHEPPLLYLDEPTIGLDVVAKAAMRDFIGRVNAESGTTIVLTTHDIADIERLCHRVIIIDNGHVLYDGDLAALCRTYVPYRRILVRTGSAPLHWDIEDVRLVATTESYGQMELELHFDPAKISGPDAIGRVISRLPVSDIAVGEPHLEEVIRQIYTEGSVRTA
jgi:viologen exporter family transport system ATP-binding protein